MTNEKNVHPDFRETLYTIDKGGRRHWVYNSIVKGRFFSRRAIVMTALLLFYLAMPWLTVGGEQAIFFDIPGRRFVVFGSVFWATDTTFLFLILGILALSLFFFTAILGRVWCGWACPETVFLDYLFRPVERWIEGSPAERLRLDQSPWNFRKLRIKGTKYLIFAALCWVVASTFLAYFVGRDPLIAMMSNPPWENPFPFTVTVALMSAMLFQFGWFREQFCTVLCPYARFQSVMMDQNSLTVGYDSKRGEPRGNKKSQTQEHLGDCIDCGLCVRVCPTGIDIRNGLQLECVACASCIDACDSVMLKLGRAPGLIRYDTENGLAGMKSAYIRPRVILYALILTVFFSVLGYRLTHRQYLEAQVLRGAQDAPFSILADGRIVNHLHIHLSNKTKKLESIRIFLVEQNSDIEMILPVNPFPIPPESLQTAPVFINFPARALHDGKKKIQIQFAGSDGFSKVSEVTLLGPNHDGDEDGEEEHEHSRAEHSSSDKEHS